MLTDKTVLIKISPKNYFYWKSRNYDLLPTGGRQGKNGNQIIEVKVSDLSSNSNVRVNCTCDECGAFFSKKYSGRHDKCNVCIRKEMSINMKGNVYGTVNGHKIPSKEELLLAIEKFKFRSELIKFFNVKAYSVIERWIKAYNLPELPQGQYIENKYDINISNIKDEIYQKGFKFVSKKYNISKPGLEGCAKRFDVELITKKTEKRKHDNLRINKLLPTLIELNKKDKSLLELSSEFNISIEYIKKAFKTNNIDVVLHSYNKSKGELEIKEFINNIGMYCISKKFHKQYEIDCYVPEIKFGVEYNGEYHHSTNVNNDPLYHKNKYLFCKDQNIKLLMIYEHEWKTKQDLIKSMILSRINLIDEKIYARKCGIFEISSYEAEIFHNKNHINGYVKSSQNFGLYHNNELVSVMSFSKSRFDKKVEFEITRYSTKMNTIIIGGASKLFHYFEKKNHFPRIVSYADLRFGDGDVYSKLGFSYSHMSPPNYWYFNKRGGDKLESRIKYQKHKLPNIFENVDMELTEKEIMLKNGYLMIHDIGNNVFYKNI